MKRAPVQREFENLYQQRVMRRRMRLCARKGICHQISASLSTLEMPFTQLAGASAAAKVHLHTCCMRCVSRSISCGMLSICGGAVCRAGTAHPESGVRLLPTCSLLWTGLWLAGALTVRALHVHLLASMYPCHRHLPPQHAQPSRRLAPPAWALLPWASLPSLCPPS